MPRPKRTFEEADQGWTNEQALASDLGYDLGNGQSSSGASGNSADQSPATGSRSSSLQNSHDEYSPEDVDDEVEEEEDPAAQQAVQAGPPAKRPRRKRGDPPPDYSAEIQRHVMQLSRTGQACDRCKYRKLTCDLLPYGCGKCVALNQPCVTTDRITGRPIPRNYLEQVEVFAYQSYRESQHLQGLLVSTWDFAHALRTQVQQLLNVVTESGLPHPPLHIPEHLLQVMHAINDGAASAPVNPPPPPPPGGPTSGLLSQGNVPPNVQVPVAGPAMGSRLFQPQYPGTASRVQGAAAQADRCAVKRRPDPRRNYTQRPSAGHSAMGAPTRVPPVVGVNVDVAYPNFQLQGAPHPQNPRTHQPTVPPAYPHTSANHGIGHAHPPYNGGAPIPRAANRTRQQHPQNTHTETIDLTSDEDDYLPQGLGDVFPAPPGSGIPAGPSGQSNFPLPPQHGNDTIDPSVIMPDWLSSYGLGDWDTSAQAATDDPELLLTFEQPSAPEVLDTGAQDSADQRAPAAQAVTADGENTSQPQSSGNAPSSSPLDFSILDNVNVDDLSVGSFDAALGAEIDAALVQCLGAGGNPEQSQQPPVSAPGSPVLGDVDVDAELAQFLAKDPALAQPQPHPPPPVEPAAGSPTARSTHADDVDSLFDGSLSAGPSPTGGETAPTNEAPAGSRYDRVPVGSVFWFCVSDLGLTFSPFTGIDLLSMIEIL